VLLTTQYLEEADALADRILVIDHGTVIAEGTSAELKSRFASTVIEVGFRDAESAGLAAAVLAPVGDLRTKGEVVRIGVSGDASAQAMLAAVRALDGAGMEPATMVLREPTLDDVFLALTGHAAEEVDDTDDDVVVAKGRGRKSKAEPRPEGGAR